MPLISVLMPVHNGEKYLSLALESVLAQTFEDFEFIIINDGSTDKSEEIILSYDDQRIHYLSNNTNCGVTKTLNRGLGLATGKYIARLDADDLAVPLRLERQMTFLDKKRSLLVGSWAHVIDGNGEIIRNLKPLTAPLNLRLKLLFSNAFIHSSTMFNAAAAKSLGGYDERIRYAQDYDLWSRLSRLGDVYNIPEYLVCWRETEDNISAKKKYQQEETVKKTSEINRRIIFGIDFDNSYLKYIASPLDALSEKSIKNSHDDADLVIEKFCNYFAYSKHDFGMIKTEMEKIRLYLVETNLFRVKLPVVFSAVFGTYMKIHLFSTISRILFKKIIGENNSKSISRFIDNK